MTTPSLPPRVRAAERPILFSGAMVRALLAGTKTQTRRVVNGAPEDWTPIGPESFSPTVVDRRGEEQPGPEAYGAGNEDGSDWIRCPYGKPGDRLWVRECYSGDGQCVGVPPRDWVPGSPIWYWADGNPSRGDWTKPKPGMHMPLWASRITMEITGVRVERLQDISEADAIAEGIEGFELPECGGRFWLDYRLTDAEAGCSPALKSPVDSYRWLWESINGPGSWDANPFVWVVEFRKLATEAAA